MLGYGFDQNAAPLVEAIAQLHDGRWLRSEEISRKLSLKGMPGALEGARAIQQELGDSGNAPARPHFADWMVREGFVKDRAEAFRKWLGAGKLGDVKQHWPTLEDTVGTLRSSGAWVSLALPWHYDSTRSNIVGNQLAAFAAGEIVMPGMRQAHPGPGGAQCADRIFQGRPVLLHITQLAGAQPFTKRFGAMLSSTFCPANVTPTPSRRINALLIKPPGNPSRARPLRPFALRP